MPPCPGGLSGRISPLATNASLRIRLYGSCAVETVFHRKLIGSGQIQLHVFRGHSLCGVPDDPNNPYVRRLAERAWLASPEFERVLRGALEQLPSDSFEKGSRHAHEQRLAKFDQQIRDARLRP